jgi:hypothetical protein
MNTGFFTPDPAELTVDFMNNVSRTATGQMLNAEPAANADELGEARPIESRGVAATGAWDAYDVWRRLIKDARDRRKAQTESN